jgi:ABC-type amino acid transport substrate-binding protein
VVALTALLAPSAACAQNAAPPEIEYAYPDQSIWTTRLSADGEPANPLLTLAAELFSRAGLSWHGKSYPAARMFYSLRNDSAQFSILVKARMLEECCLFSRKPVAITEVRAYHFAGTPTVVGRDSLVGLSVITVQGYSYSGLGAFINDPAHRIQNNVAQTHDAAFLMLQNGRAEVVVDYAGPAAEILAAHPLAGLQSEVIERLDVHLVLSRSYPDAEAVMARLEAIAERIPPFIRQ